MKSFTNLLDKKYINDMMNEFGEYSIIFSKFNINNNDPFMEKWIITDKSKYNNIDMMLIDINNELSYIFMNINETNEFIIECIEENNRIFEPVIIQELSNYFHNLIKINRIISNTDNKNNYRNIIRKINKISEIIYNSYVSMKQFNSIF